jgi:hypothetical protein
MCHVVSSKMMNYMQVKNNLVQTMVRVSVEMASVSDWMAVFSPGIVCAFF